MLCVIDELKICYVADQERLESLRGIAPGEYIDIPGFRLYRVISDRFRHCYDITSGVEKVAQLRFGLYTEDDGSETHVFFKVLNRVLYETVLLQKVLTIPEHFGMVCNNYTALDLAVDTHLNVPSVIKRMMRDKDVTTIINGKAVKDRRAIIPGVSFEYSSSLDRLRHLTVTIKQKKAINNKNDGITVQAYDKRAEVKNHSDKQYILDYYGDPKRLYRLEIRLRYRELKDYMLLTKTPATPDLVFDQHFLVHMFCYHLAAVIRFTKGRRKIQWEQLLECNDRV